ncbi:hypothetical protein GE09DRAFT_1247178 [Coniochaeta sp. 2T2.1]|nr:hypothetical protein GE09DRAFT_1247178 [Coniochaeta sp. 2T2.1]
MARNVYRLLVLGSACFLLFLVFPYLRYYGDYIRQTNPFSDQRYIEQGFTPTKSELSCLHGTQPPDNATLVDSEPISDPIPNIVHFIFGLKKPPRRPQRGALVSLDPDHLYIHYTYLASPPSADPNASPLSNTWIARLALHPAVHLIHHRPHNPSSTHHAHLSDTLRLSLLLSHGGIYLDIDAFALRPLPPLLNPPAPHDVVLGHEGGNRWGLCNAVIAARPNATFIRRWLDSYSNIEFAHEKWNFHSVLLPKEMADQHPGEVCALPPDAFFWPTWTWRHVEWMHEPLGRGEARFWEREIDRNGGGITSGQMVYHAWKQMAWERYLKELTPRTVREKVTRFNFLVRRFVEDDL